MAWYSVQLRLAQLFSSSKSVHAWCFEAILIANNYTPASSKGNICVLHTPKSNHKHSVSMVMTPPTVNKIIIIALYLVTLMMCLQHWGWVVSLTLCCHQMWLQMCLFFNKVSLKQNADCEQQVNCSNFGTVGKLMI